MRTLAGPLLLVDAGHVAAGLLTSDLCTLQAHFAPLRRMACASPESAIKSAQQRSLALFPRGLPPRCLWRCAAPAQPALAPWESAKALVRDPQVADRPRTAPKLSERLRTRPDDVQGLFKWKQWQVVGRHLPTEAEPNPTVYRMKVWATDSVRAKSKFW